jgi:hypothetical protein
LYEDDISINDNKLVLLLRVYQTEYHKPIFLFLENRLIKSEKWYRDSLFNLLFFKEPSMALHFAAFLWHGEGALVWKGVFDRKYFRRGYHLRALRKNVTKW